MAARRLILVMLALLVLSSIAAALIPVDRDRPSPRETPATRAEEPRIPAGTSVHKTVSADASKPARIALEAGDQLDLTVTSKRFGQVEIAAFGELDDVDPDFPAHFDLLALEPGSFDVRLLDRGTIARIEVAAADQPEGGSSNEPPGSSTAGSTAGASSAS